ncbi:MAG: hypothetical protein HEP80_23490 [Dolichospermum sp. UKL201]|nr:MAG: hypothetical protein HEP80_23490 [Dolichospermum sp. UKL201]
MKFLTKAGIRLAETCGAGQLRRLQCSWAIEQAIITTYQVQNEVSAVSDSYECFEIALFNYPHNIGKCCNSSIDQENPNS